MFLVLPAQDHERSGHHKILVHAPLFWLPDLDLLFHDPPQFWSFFCCVHPFLIQFHAHSSNSKVVKLRADRMFNLQLFDGMIENGICRVDIKGPHGIGIFIWLIVSIQFIHIVL